MKITTKTDNVIAVYRVLSQATTTKMDDGDRIKVWKIGRKLRPTFVKYEEELKDASEKFKPTIDGFDKQLEKVQSYERMIRLPNLDATTLPIGAAEYNQFIVDVMTPYNNMLNNAMKEFTDQDIELEFDGLTDEVFCKLASENKWTIGQQVKISEIIVG